MKKLHVILLLLFVAALLAGTAFSQTEGEAPEGATPAPCANCPGPGGMGMHHGMMGAGPGANMPCGCGMQGMGMAGCGCGCGMQGMHGMMGGGMMGGGMCGMMGGPGMRKGMMSSGLLGIMGVHPGMRGMRALNDPKVKEYLSSPEIKSFLDDTKDLRRNLLLRKFDYFETARNPQAKPEDLKKLKQEIKKLQAEIYVKSPDMMDMSDKDDTE